MMNSPLSRWLCWSALLVGVVWFNVVNLGSGFAEPSAAPTATPQAVLIVPGATPLPAEYFRTVDQSSGITVGAVLLVAIITISALSALVDARKKKRKGG